MWCFKTNTDISYAAAQDIPKLEGVWNIHKPRAVQAGEPGESSVLAREPGGSWAPPKELG